MHVSIQLQLNTQLLLSMNMHKYAGGIIRAKPSLNFRLAAEAPDY